MFKILGSILFFYLLMSFNTAMVLAQTDTIATSTITPTGPVKKDRTPRKAAIRSAIIPGWGQAYNKKYWKIPVIYVAGGAAAYFYITNAKVYRENRDLLKNNPDSPSADIYRINRDRFREYRDWNIAMMVGLYLLNIVDANVDAHLREFDVDDNLAFTVKPYLYQDIYNSPVTGISLNLKFKK
jgi:hypothetical protein